MKRSPLRRRRLFRAWRRAEDDKVTPELVAQVLRRDRGCVASKLQPGHECRDQFGYPHAPDDLARLSIEHVHDGGGMMGKRAASDLAHCLALCHGANVGVPSKAQRTLFREYLLKVNQ